MDPRIQLAIDVINRDLAGPLSVTRLAHDLNLSRSRFTHLFRAHVGLSPGRFVRNARLERAAALVRDSTFSIKEVMAAVGFSDPSHFARDFRRYHGVSPRRFRAGGRSPHVSIAPQHARAADRR